MKVVVRTGVPLLPQVGLLCLLLLWPGAVHTRGEAAAMEHGDPDVPVVGAFDLGENEVPNERVSGASGADPFGALYGDPEGHDDAHDPEDHRPNDISDTGNRPPVTDVFNRLPDSNIFNRLNKTSTSSEQLVPMVRQAFRSGTINGTMYSQSLGNIADEGADEGAAEGTDEGHTKVVTQEEAHECRRPCFRKCCSPGQAFNMDTQTCQKAEFERTGFSEGVAVVVGLPRCSGNFTVTSIIGTDGKRRLKVGSYGVAHVWYCTDHLLEEGKEVVVYESLICDDILEESQIVNIIRKTSIIGNIVSALCITAIYVCHIFIPKLNEKQGLLFIFFCTSIFAKGVFEAPGRGVKFTAYPTYTICVINSLLLMYARASVPIWLSVLCMDITRRASTIGNLFQMISSGSGVRRWILFYVAYGLGLALVQCVIALLLTNLSNNTQKQSTIYDRTCLFTDRDVRNMVFLYPSIAIAGGSMLLMVYTHRHRKTWCTVSVVEGKRTVHVDLEEQQDGGRGGGNVAYNPPHLARHDLFRAHSAVDFVAEFWQQVGLVFFWVLLTTSMLLVQLTGLWIPSHITYLMDSFQGLYVLVIFLFNRQKRLLVIKKLGEVYENRVKNKIHFPVHGLPFRTRRFEIQDLTCKSRRLWKRGASARASTLKLIDYQPKISMISDHFHVVCMRNSPAHMPGSSSVHLHSGPSKVNPISNSFENSLQGAASLPVHFTMTKEDSKMNKTHASSKTPSSETPNCNSPSSGVPVIEVSSLPETVDVLKTPESNETRVNEVPISSEISPVLGIPAVPTNPIFHKADTFPEIILECEQFAFHMLTASSKTETPHDSKQSLGTPLRCNKFSHSSCPEDLPYPGMAFCNETILSKRMSPSSEVPSVPETSLPTEFSSCPGTSQSDEGPVSSEGYFSSGCFPTLETQKYPTTEATKPSTPILEGRPPSENPLSIEHVSLETPSPTPPSDDSSSFKVPSAPEAHLSAPPPENSSSFEEIPLPQTPLSDLPPEEFSFMELSAPETPCPAPPPEELLSFKTPSAPETPLLTPSPEGFSSLKLLSAPETPPLAPPPEDFSSFRVLSATDTPLPKNAFISPNPCPDSVPRRTQESPSSPTNSQRLTLPQDSLTEKSASSPMSKAQTNILDLPEEENTRL